MSEPETFEEYADREMWDWSDVPREDTWNAGYLAGQRSRDAEVEQAQRTAARRMRDRCGNQASVAGHFLGLDPDVCGALEDAVRRMSLPGDEDQ